YREKFALAPPDVPVEFLNVRVAVRAPVAGATVVRAAAGSTGEASLPEGVRAAAGSTGEASGDGPALRGRRQAYFPEARGFVETAVYDRRRLAPGDRFTGPAVVEEEGSTLV